MKSFISENIPCKDLRYHISNTSTASQNNPVPDQMECPFFVSLTRAVHGPHPLGETEVRPIRLS